MSAAQGIYTGEDRLICSVTEDDNAPTPTGHSRAQIRTENLWHRATFVIVRCYDDAGDDDDVAYLLASDEPHKFTLLNGMVYYGESYSETAERLVKDGITHNDVSGISVAKHHRHNTQQSSDNSAAQLVEQFRFPYCDDHLRVWGQLYEFWCHKSDLHPSNSLQEVSIKDLQQQQSTAALHIHTHVIRLYLQRLHDIKVNRKLLKGYSSSNLESYGIRPKPKVIFFDCDDCLYFDNWTTAKHLTAKINEWCMQQANLPDGAAYQLYKQHGTALKGLLAEGRIRNTDEAIDEFLRKVHAIPIQDLLKPDPQLRQMLQALDPSIPKFIFTASVSHHAQRCIAALGIGDMFEDAIIDVKACNLETKHAVSSFEAAMKIANVTNPEDCLFLDDSTKNIHAARQVGWRCILVGRVGRDCGTTISTEHAELEIDRIHDLATVFPELFLNTST